MFQCVCVYRLRCRFGVDVEINDDNNDFNDGRLIGQRKKPWPTFVVDEAEKNKRKKEDKVLVAVVVVDSKKEKK